MKNNRNNTGFIALTFVIIAAALILVIGTTIAITSMEEVERARGVEKSNYALALANSCAEIGVLRLLEDWDYEGRERITLGNSFCNILAVEKLTPPTHLYYGRRLRAWATVNGYRREVEVEIRDVRDGLVGWWKFDEEGGCMAIDSSESRINVGELMPICPANSPTWGIDRYNRANRALSFDGVDDFVEVGNGGFNISKGTYELWFKPNELPFPSWDTLIHHETPTVNRNSINIKGVSGTSRLAFVVSNDAGVPLGAWGGTSTSDLVVGNWYHVIGTWDSTIGEIRIYLNGVLQDTSIGTEFPSVMALNIGIGKNLVHAGRESNGTIDEVRIYNRALTAAEITTRHRAGIYLREIY